MVKNICKHAKLIFGFDTTDESQMMVHIPPQCLFNISFPTRKHISRNCDENWRFKFWLVLKIFTGKVNNQLSVESLRNIYSSGFGPNLLFLMLRFPSLFIWRVGSVFGINTMKMWILPALYQFTSTVHVCGLDVWDIFLAHFRLYLNPTA